MIKFAFVLWNIYKPSLVQTKYCINYNLWLYQKICNISCSEKMISSQDSFPKQEQMFIPCERFERNFCFIFEAADENTKTLFRANNSLHEECLKFKSAMNFKNRDSDVKTKLADFQWSQWNDSDFSNCLK